MNPNDAFFIVISSIRPSSVLKLKDRPYFLLCSCVSSATFSSTSRSLLISKFATKGWAMKSRKSLSESEVSSAFSQNVILESELSFIFEEITVTRRTLHSPIDSWSFHLESTWTHGVHLESRWNLFGREPSQIFVYFHLDSTWIPDGLHGLHMESMDSTPFHITLHSIFHLSMDSTWIPPGLQQS